MADDAGDAFASSRRAIHVAHADRFAGRHSHRCVTTYAKVAQGAVRQLDELAGHGVEHGRHLSIGMRTGRPFPEMLRMTFPARFG